MSAPRCRSLLFSAKGTDITFDSSLCLARRQDDVLLSTAARRVFTRLDRRQLCNPLASAENRRIPAASVAALVSFATLAFSQHHIDDPTTSDTRAAVAAVGEHIALMAAGVLEGVGKNRHAIEGPIDVQRLGQCNDRGGPPSRVERHRAERVSDHATQERGLRPND